MDELVRNIPVFRSMDPAKQDGSLLQILPISERYQKIVSFAAGFQSLQREAGGAGNGPAPIPVFKNYEFSQLSGKLKIISPRALKSQKLGIASRKKCSCRSYPFGQIHPGFDGDKTMHGKCIADFPESAILKAEKKRSMPEQRPEDPWKERGL